MKALAFIVALLSIAPAWAYVGPGAGLGMIGSLLAVIGAVLLAIFGIVLLPIRMLLKKRREREKPKS